ncbi:MAG: GNAT family N-acetyltransferase [Ignavibacteriales bacterium]|nr:MAG: GNAT family N-acetyltransferase [Ignavibacteriales bacterium]
MVIRSAEKEDVGLILSFIKELADYEKLTDAVTADENLLTETMFGKDAVPKSLLAFYKDEPAGFAIYFYNFSTFIGKPGLYLEDVYVKPELRGKGIGKQVLIYLAKIASEKDCGRFEWSVLDWNEPSIKFYKNLGAKPMDDWTVFRLDRMGIENLSRL